ncbi:MAG: Hemolysin, plasmid [Candidatus Erwinia impunctatus]
MSGATTTEGSNGTQQHIVKFSTALTDTDGSESLSGVTFKGIPAGSIIIDSANNTSYTVGADGSYTFSNRKNAASLSGTLTVVSPLDAGNFQITAQASATESSNGSSATATIQADVSQYGYQVGTAAGETLNGTASNDLIIGDVSGLHIEPGKNYNIAFMADSSGSMSDASIASMKTQLKSVIDTLYSSAHSKNAGTVNVFFADFDSQVGITASVNLADANALNKLYAALDSMVSGGGTNYEDVFKTTANWFDSDMVKSNVGTNLTYFITDGNSTFHQENERESVVTYSSKYGSTQQTLTIDAINYQLGKEVYQTIAGASRMVIDSDGNVYQYSSSRWGLTSSVIGQVHAQGDGTYEISTRGGFGYSESATTDANSVAGYNALSKVSSVEAIGIGDDLNSTSLQRYDSDGTVLTNIDASKLSEAILSTTKPFSGGADTINGGDGNDILFGDAVTLDGISGNGLQALQAYVASKSGLQSTPTVEQVQKYITTHSAEFDRSSSLDGNDVLNGGKGDDILFGQGGNDTLNGGEGNDILYGGAGNDVLIGGKGDDILIGGAGADTFKWMAGDTGHDIIKDFNSNEGDKIDLSDLLGDVKSGADLSRYIRITETTKGTATIEVSTHGTFKDSNGGTTDVAITVDHYTGSLPSLDSLVAKPENH